MDESRTTASQLRQPRLAEIVAGRVRDEILNGNLEDGHRLPRQEEMFSDFQVSSPSLREALRILETEGLITVQRGKVGGAIVHLPSEQRIAYMVAMVLQTKLTQLNDVGKAIVELEPICTSLCAERPDRLTTVVPALRAVIERQRDAVERSDSIELNMAAREFHEGIATGCGSTTLMVTLGALETLWTRHESEWARRAAAAGAMPEDEAHRLALAVHEKILAAIEAGDGPRAAHIARAHLDAVQAFTLSGHQDRTVNANLVR